MLDEAHVDEDINGDSQAIMMSMVSMKIPKIVR